MLPLIEAAFQDLPEVNVKLFAPTTTNGSENSCQKSEKPKMTPGRAAIVKLLSIYREMMYPLTQIEVQKLAYFLASAGQD